MKIGLVVPGGVDRSGEEKVIPALLWLIGRLAIENEVWVCALHQYDYETDYELLGAHIHNVGGRGKPVLARASAAVFREHVREPFDVLHGLWVRPSGTVAIAAGKLLGVPTVVHVAGGELVYHRDISYGGQGTRKSTVLNSLALRHASAVTVPSEPIEDLVNEIRPDVRRINLGVSVPDWPSGMIEDEVPEDPLVLAVGSINAVKDHLTLIEAIERVAHRVGGAKLRLIGEDVLGGHIQRRITELGISGRVEVTGFTRHRDLRRHVDEATILAISSRHEAGPVVALEAAVAGLPIVGTRVGHLAEWRDRGCLTVQPGNPEELADAMIRALQDWPATVSRAEWAKDWALEHDADWTATRFLQLYRELIGEPWN